MTEGNWWEVDPTAEEYARMNHAPRIPDLTPPEAPPFMARVGMGMRDPFVGTKQIALHTSDPAAAKAYDEQIAAAEKQYQAGRGEDAGIDWARLAGNVAAAAPASAAAAMAAPVASGSLPGIALAGALSGASTPVTEGAQNDRGDVPYWIKKGTQTVFGAVMAPVAALATKAGIKGLVFSGDKMRRFTKAAWVKLPTQQRQRVVGALSDAAARSGISWDDLDDAMRSSLADDAVMALKTGGTFDDLTADAIVRKRNFERFGYVKQSAPTQAQLSRDPGQWRAERELAKMDEAGAPIRERYMAQDQQTLQNVQGVAQGMYPGETGTIRDFNFRTGLEAEKTAQDFSKASQQQVSAAYDAAKASGGMGDRVVDVGSLKTRLVEIYNAYGDKVPAQIRSNVEALVNSDSAHPNRLSPTVDNIDSVLKAVNKRRFNAADDAERAAMIDLESALNDALDSLAEAGGPGAAQLREASSMAARRFFFIGRKRADSRKIVDDLIYGKTSPDKFVEQKVMNGDTRALYHLRRFFLKMPNEFDVKASQGAQAWDMIRSAVIRNLEAKAKPGEVLNGGVLYKQWKALGPRQAALFNKSERDVLEFMFRAASDLHTQPPYAAVNSSNTASGVINGLTKASQLPIVGRVANNILKQYELSSVFARRLAEQKAVEQAIAGVAAGGPSEAARQLAGRLYGGAPGAPWGLGNAAALAGGAMAGAAPRAFARDDDQVNR